MLGRPELQCSTHHEKPDVPRSRSETRPKSESRTRLGKGAKHLGVRWQSRNSGSDTAFCTACTPTQAPSPLALCRRTPQPAGTKLRVPPGGWSRGRRFGVRWQASGQRAQHRFGNSPHRSPSQKKRRQGAALQNFGVRWRSRNGGSDTAFWTACTSTKAPSPRRCRSAGALQNLAAGAGPLFSVPHPLSSVLSSIRLGLVDGGRGRRHQHRRGLYGHRHDWPAGCRSAGLRRRLRNGRRVRGAPTVQSPSASAPSLALTSYGFAPRPWSLAKADLVLPKTSHPS